MSGLRADLVIDPSDANLHGWRSRRRLWSTCTREAVRPLHRSKTFPCARELWGQAFEFFEVQGRQRFETVGTVASEM